MEGGRFSMAERYHEVMSHLLMSGISSVDSLIHNLYKITAFTLNDLCQLQNENSLKTKVQLLLDRVMCYDCGELFLQSLNETLPQVYKALMDQPNGSIESGSPDVACGRNPPTTVTHSQDLVSHLMKERDILSGQVENISHELQDVKGKFAQAQSETANILRQSEADRQELAVMRRRSLMGGGSSSIINQMYEKMLERYDEQKNDMTSLKQQLSAESNERAKVQSQLEMYMRELSDANFKCNSIVKDHERMAKQFKSLNKRNETVQTDLNRVREERTQIRREYALVMSERDAVLKNIEKLQEEIADVNKELSKSVNDKKMLVDEKEQLIAKINSLQNSQTQPQTSIESDINAIREELFVAQRERKQALAQYEAELNRSYSAKKAQESAVEMTHKFRQENETLTTSVAALTAELKESNKECADANRLRHVAFVERDKMRSERDELKLVNEKWQEEREVLVKQLESEMKEHDTTKEQKKRLSKELRGLRDGNVSQRNGNSHSHDSAIDAGDWGSEDLKSLQNEYFPSKGIKTRICIVKKPCSDIAVDVGLFVTRAGLRNLAPGERIITVNNIIVDAKNCISLKNEMNGMTTPCSLKLLQTNFETSDNVYSTNNNNGVFIPTSPDKKFNDAACQTTEQKQIHSRKNKNKRNSNYTKSLILPEHRETIGPLTSHLNGSMTQPISPTGTWASSEGESHYSLRTTTSDSTYTNFSHIPRQSSQKSSDSSASFAKKSGKKKFWKINRKKNQAESKQPTGGTWPRIESPSLSNILTGGLSVFTPKKKPRPLLNPNTFTPPTKQKAPSSPLPSDSNVGQTPPTVRGNMTIAPPPPEFDSKDDDDLPPSPGFETVVPKRGKYGKPVKIKNNRPMSAPIENQPLSTGKEPPTGSNSNNSSNIRPKSASRRPTSPNTNYRSAKQIQVTSFSNKSLHSMSTTPLSLAGTPKSRDTKFNFPQQSDVTVTQSPYVQQRGSVFTTYKRQESAPAMWDANKMATLPLPVSSNKSPDISSRRQTPTNMKPQSSTSLPRPSSARPSTSSGSHASIETGSHRSRTLDYRRIRMPSELSVSMKQSGSERGSISQSSDRSTPIIFTPSHSPPPISDKGLIILGSSLSSISNVSTASVRGRRPVSTDPRYVQMIKGTDPIGISIVGGGEKGGIFVSRVIEDSLAARAGIEYGDQLLEYNGINLRTANETQARSIMSQSHPNDTITFLAQYNLEKYRSSIESNLSDTLSTKKTKLLLYPEEKDEGTITPDTTPRVSPQLEEALRSQSLAQPRYIFLSGNCTGISLCGGNRYGVFISSINAEAIEAKASLKVGDKILEYNGTDLQNVTLEQASLLLEKTVFNAAFQVIHDPTKFKQIQSIAGDYFYVRALFDNAIETTSGNLCFTRNTILLIDNTFPNHKMGQWSAWLVDEQGEKTKRGMIPSKFTYEKEILPQRDFDDSVSCAGSTTGKKFSNTGRRSFFKRKKPNRSSSRSSGEFRMQKSVSETSIESVDTSFEHSSIAYQVVEKHISECKRPVVVFGPHSAQVNERLSREYATSFVRCQLEILQNPEEPVDINILETYRKATETLALSVATLKTAMRQAGNRHVLLELTHEAIDRLHAVQIYPIIIFIDFNSAKKIKECQDRIPGREKLSMKQSKELLENATNIKKHLVTKYLGTVFLHGGSPSAVTNQVRTIVDHEQSKVLWLHAKTQLLSY